jgi:O-antigen/teichoic acid export membrane protein
MMRSLRNLRALLREGDELRAKLLRGAIGVGFLKLLSMPLMLVVSILLARALGPEGYGQYAFIMALISILALPAGAGFVDFVTREAARYEHDENWQLLCGLRRRSQQWAIFASLFLVSGIAIITLDTSQADSQRAGLLLIGSLMLPLLGLNALLRGFLRGLGYVFHAQLPQLLVLPSFHLLFVGVLLVLDRLTPATALGSQIASMMIGLLLGAFLLRNFFPKQLMIVQPAYENRVWGRAMTPFLLLTAAGLLNGQIGILLIGWMGDDQEVAALQLAQSLAMLVALSLTIVNMVIAPHATRAFREGNDAGVQRLSLQSARAALAVSLPVALPLVFMGDQIIRLVYGEVYVDLATWPLVILALGQLVNVAFGSVGLFLTMSGHELDTLVGQIAALVVNVIAAFSLIPHFGVIGAAISISLGLVTWNVILAVKFARRLGLRPSAF